MNNPCQCCQRKLRFIRQINGNYMHSMVIPEWFVKYFGGEVPETVKLEVANGNIYDVGVTDSMNRTILKSGWAPFVDANKIEENYSLMFRYLGNSRFKVTIFDSNGKEKALCCVWMKSASDVKSLDNRHGDYSSSSLAGTTQSSASEGSDSDGCPNESSEDDPSGDESMKLDDQMLSNNYVLSGRCDLTVAQEAKIHALVAEIQPEIPVLVVLIKKTNVEPKTDLVIRKDYALVYFPGESQTITLQVPTKSNDWQCNLRIGPDGRRNLLLHNFVHDNSIKEGDICLFQPMTNVEQRKFTVTVHVLHKASTDYPTDIRTCNGSKIADVKDEPPMDGEEIFSSDHEEHEAFANSSADESLELDDVQMLPKDCVLSGRCFLTVPQKAKMRALVTELRPKKPVLVVLMKKSNVEPKSDMVIRKDYARAYFPRESQTIALQVPRKRTYWEGNFRIRSDGGYNLHLGEFVHYNKVRVGDICIFQPMTNAKQTRFTMTVHVLHKASIDYPTDGRTCGGSNHAKVQPPIDGEDMSSSDHEEHGASENSQGASEPPFILPDKLHLTQAQEKKVLEKLEQIESQLPVYVAIVNKMNVCRRNTSPISIFGLRYATTHLEKKQATGHRAKEGVISLVLQREGKRKTWATEMRWSAHRTSHQLRVLRGWPAFSRDNHLREGDLCLFKLMKNEEPLKMIVSVIRRDKC